MYTYSAPTEKRVFRMIFELLAGYICLTTLSLIKTNTVQTIFITFLIVCFALLTVETIIIILYFNKKQTRKWLKILKKQNS